MSDRLHTHTHTHTRTHTHTHKLDLLARGEVAKATITLECVDIIQLQSSDARRRYIVITAGYFPLTPQIPPQLSS
jgi:hypothetical protein